MEIIMNFFLARCICETLLWPNVKVIRSKMLLPKKILFKQKSYMRYESPITNHSKVVWLRLQFFKRSNPTIKVTRSKILVLRKRSYHKEYTCKIRKSYRHTFKRYGQGQIDRQSKNYTPPNLWLQVHKIIHVLHTITRICNANLKNHNNREIRTLYRTCKNKYEKGSDSCHHLILVSNFLTRECILKS